MSDLFGLEKPHKISDGDEVSHLITVYDVAVLGIVRGLLEAYVWKRQIFAMLLLRISMMH